MKFDKSSLVSIGLVVLGIVVLYFGVFQGAKLLFASGDELGETKQELVNWEARQDLTRALSEKIKESTFQQELQIALPDSSATAELLSSIEAAAFKSQVGLNDFSPSLDYSTSSAKKGTITSYELTITAEGSYNNLKNFISRLEKIKRVSRIDSLTLSKNLDGNLSASFKLIVYYLAK